MDTISRSKKLRAAGTVLVSVAVLAGASLAGASGSEKQNRKDLARAKKVTARFHNEAAAIDAGYMRTDECVELEGAGGMGFHYVKPSLMDGSVSVEQPEILLFMQEPNGKRRLVGLEYLTIDADQDLSTDDDRPSLFGVPFDGPMPGHGPGMPVHYDLHVWLWKKNPSGLFAVWNPKFACP